MLSTRKKTVPVLGQNENFRLCLVRSGIVLEDTLRTKSAWINLTCLDLRDPPGQRARPLKRAADISGSFWFGDGRYWWSWVPTWGQSVSAKRKQSRLLNKLHWIFWWFLELAFPGIASLSISSFFWATLLKGNVRWLFSEVGWSLLMTATWIELGSL